MIKMAFYCKWFTLVLSYIIWKVPALNRNTSTLLYLERRGSSSFHTYVQIQNLILWVLTSGWRPDFLVLPRSRGLLGWDGEPSQENSAHSCTCGGPFIHAEVRNLFFFPYAVLCDTCWSWPFSKALWSVLETGRWLSCLVWQIYFLFVSIVFPSERVKMLLKWIIYHGEGIEGSQSLWWSLLLKASHL